MNTGAIKHRIKTRVGSLAIYDEGAGTPVVLWPSLFSDHRLYRHVVRQLRSEWRTLCIDGPGFGQSDPPESDVQTEIYADTIIEVLDQMGIEKAFVAGCSWGGQIAAHVGARAPNRVHGILIMNSPLAPSIGGHLFEILGTRWMGASEFWGKGVARSFFSRTTTQDHPTRVREFVSVFTEFDKRAAAVTVRTVLTRFAGLQEILPQLAVPTTILMGNEDTLYPVSRMTPMARLSSIANIKVIPACGHLIPIEAPEAVVDALKDLLAESSMSGRAAKEKDEMK